MRFADVYIRPAAAPLIDFAFMTPGMGSLLDTWDRLDFIKRAPSVEIAPDISEDYNDGTSGVASEKISISFATFRCDKAHHGYLRTLHNTQVDLLWFDPADDSFITAAFGLSLNVATVAASNESAVINLSATRSFATQPSLAGIFLLGGLSPYGIISGYVFRPGGSTPDAGVLVSVTGSTGTFTDTTDAEGNFLLFVNAAPAGTTFTFTLTRSGATYPTGQTLVASQKTEVSRNFTALT